MSKLKTVLVTGAVALGGLGATSTAQAAGLGYISGGANVRSCASTGCGAYGSAYGGWYTIYCTSLGGWANGSNRWFLASVSTTSGWRQGWVHASNVPAQPRVGSC